MTSKLAAEASRAIHSLKEENEKLGQEIEHIKWANSVAFNIAKKTDMPLKDLESKIAELYTTPEEELKVLEKAASMSLNGDFMSLGELSDRLEDDGSVDPLTSFLLGDYN